MPNLAQNNIASITEIFSSLQGEGPHLGQRHLFIRFEDCDLRCRYCDEWGKEGIAMSLAQVVDRVEQTDREWGPHAYVSLTGGEPLLALPFLKPLAALLKEKSFKIYLETSGVLWQALEEVVGVCDVIAMDMKPASVTQEKSFEEEHRRFLEIAKAKEVFVKMVVSDEIDRAEFIRLVQIIRDVAPQTPLILQPMSADMAGEKSCPWLDTLTVLQTEALRFLPDVRMIPRLHKILNIR